MKKLPEFLLSKEVYRDRSSYRRPSTAFIDKTIQKLAELLRMNHQQMHLSPKNSLISGISIRTRLIVFIFFILLISFLKPIAGEVVIGVIILILHLFINNRFIKTYKRIILFTFFFGLLIAAPSTLNLITKGDVLWRVIVLSKSYDFWIYHIPQVIGFTKEGLLGMSLLTLRVFNSISISFLLISTTSFNDIIKGLKMFKIPDSLLMIITLAYLYIIILSNLVAESYLAMNSRIIGHMDNREVQQLVAGRISHIFKMSRRHFERTFQAMLARGYTGEVVLYSKEKMAVHDYFIIGGTLLLALLFFIK
jgi:cobalt/nickel transport system permease protein